MNNDLKLTMNSEPVTSAGGPDFSTGVAKKKSGCGCLAGCLGVLLLFIAPFIAGGIYVASLSDEQMGEKIVGFLANTSYTQSVKDAINSSDKMTPEEKTVFLSLYDGFLTKYHALPPQQQAIIHKNAYAIIKTIFTAPEKLNSKEPPEEFLQILDVLAIAPQQTLNQSTDTQTSIATFTATATATTTDIDPYGFGVDNNRTDRGTETTPSATATASGNKTNFDF